MRDLVILPVETDYQTKITLTIDDARLKTRGCTFEDMMAALGTNKKFKPIGDNDTITLQLVDES